MSDNTYNKDVTIDSSKPRRFFAGLLESATQISKAEEGGILIVDSSSGELRVEVFKGLGVENKKRTLNANPEESVCAAAAVSKEIIRISDARKDGRFQALSDSRIKSELVVPLVHENQCIGLVNLESPRLRAFSPKIQEEVREFVASQVFGFRIALLEFNRYFLERQLEAVRDVTELMLFHSDSPQLVLERTLEHCLTLTEADTGGILLMTDDREYLKLKVHKGLDLDYDGINIRRDEGFVWQCMKAGRALNIWNVHEKPEIYKKLSAHEIKSELVVPLIFNNDVFGVINIESSSYSFFNFAHMHTLSLFAHQVAFLLQLTAMRKRWEGVWAMVQWGNLSQNFAHRMNNLVGSAKVLAERIEKGSSNPSIQGKAKKIQKGTAEALRVVQEYKKRFRWEERFFDIYSAVRETISRIETPPSINISSDIPDNPLVLKLPEPQIMELVRELICNSIKYMGDRGGEILIKLSSKWDVLSLEVLDTGPGFGTGAKDELLERGRRGSQDAQGSGYGLWWVTQLVQALGGSLSIGDQPKRKGGMVCINIPITGKIKHRRT